MIGISSPCSGRFLIFLLSSAIFRGQNSGFPQSIGREIGSLQRRREDSFRGFLPALPDLRYRILREKLRRILVRIAEVKAPDEPLELRILRIQVRKRLRELGGKPDRTPEKLLPALDELPPRKAVKADRSGTSASEERVSSCHQDPVQHGGGGADPPRGKPAPSGSFLRLFHALFHIRD